MVNLVKRLLYRSFVGGIKAYQRVFLDFHVWGRENIPTGPKLYVTNHITSTDPFWVLPVFTEPVHIVNGPGYHSRMSAKLLDVFEQINAMPARRKTVVARAVEYLKRGEAVYIAPEGDIQEPFQLGRFYHGVAKIYREVRVPMVPIALVAPKRSMRKHRFSIVVEDRVYRMVSVLRGPYLINVGKPLMPDIPNGTDEEQNEYITALVKQRISSLVEDVRLRKFWL